MLGDLSGYIVIMKRRAMVAALVAPCIAPPVSAACLSAAAGRTVLVLQSGDAEGRAHVQALQAAAARVGMEGRFCVRLRHLPIGLDDPALIEDLRRRVREPPIAIVADSEYSARCAAQAVPYTPIVFFMLDDPVRLKLVTSLRRPGGWLTGLTTYLPLHLKQTELLLALAPSARRAGLIVDSAYARENDLVDFDRETRLRYGVSLLAVQADEPERLARALAQAAHEVDGWIVPAHWLSFRYPEELVRLVGRHRKPAIYSDGNCVLKGGLIAYYARFADIEAVQVAVLESILAGIPPGDIPVQRPNRFQLAINVDTAARGPIKVPDAILRRGTRLYGAGAA